MSDTAVKLDGAIERHVGKVVLALFIAVVAGGFGFFQRTTVKAAEDDLRWSQQAEAFADLKADVEILKAGIGDRWTQKDHDQYADAMNDRLAEMRTKFESELSLLRSAVRSIEREQDRRGIIIEQFKEANTP